RALGRRRAVGGRAGWLNQTGGAARVGNLAAIPVEADAPPDNRRAVSEQIECFTEARREIYRPGVIAFIRDVRVPSGPGEAWQIDTRVIFPKRGDEDCVADPVLVLSEGIMLEADTVIEGKAPRDLPAILHVAFIDDGTDALVGIKVGLAEGRDVSEQQI